MELAHGQAPTQRNDYIFRCLCVGVRGCDLSRGSGKPGKKHHIGNRIPGSRISCTCSASARRDKFAFDSPAFRVPNRLQYRLSPLPHSPEAMFLYMQRKGHRRNWVSIGRYLTSLQSLYSQGYISRLGTSV